MTSPTDPRPAPDPQSTAPPVGPPTVPDRADFVSGPVPHSALGGRYTPDPADQSSAPPTDAHPERVTGEAAPAVHGPHGEDDRSEPGRADPQPTPPVSTPAEDSRAGAGPAPRPHDDGCRSGARHVDPPFRPTAESPPGESGADSGPVAGRVGPGGRTSAGVPGQVPADVHGEGSEAERAHRTGESRGRSRSGGVAHSGLLAPLHVGTPVEDATSDDSLLRAMLDAEAALARAQAAHGHIPAAAAAAITAAADPDRFDARELALRARDGGNPVIPLAQALRAAAGPEAAPYVHRGCTSQDILDTALMLTAARALPQILTDLTAAATTLAHLARDHRTTPMPGRTLTQHAVPTTFGLKAAGWRSLLLDATDRLTRLRLPAQLAAAAGTLAALAPPPASASASAPVSAPASAATAAAAAVPVSAPASAASAPASAASASVSAAAPAPASAPPAGSAAVSACASGPTRTRPAPASTPVPVPVPVSSRSGPPAKPTATPSPLPPAAGVSSVPGPGSVPDGPSAPAVVPADDPAGPPPAPVLDLPGAFAAELGLAAPDLPWHVLRTPVADLACALAFACCALGKPAADVLVLSRTEIGELAEGGAGGSSAMPHKANPVRATLIAAAARQAPALAATLLSSLSAEDERPAGAWHAEWQPLLDLLRLAGGAARAARDLFAHLEPRPERMRANLDLTQGLIVSEKLAADLAPLLGRDRAARTVTEAARRAAAHALPLADVLADLLAADPALAGAVDAAQLHAAADPTAYLGQAPALVDRALTRNPPWCPSRPAQPIT